MNKKTIIGLVCAILAIVPSVSADIVSYRGPEMFIIPIVGLIIIAGCITGAVFLIIWIIKKIKHKK